ncbi:MAG: hypothetical protein JNM56_12665 [Planctomycetia bacterium]|nr:hypothetical protein [Planctomycetia bacterium]
MFPPLRETEPLGRIQTAATIAILSHVFRKRPSSTMSGLRTKESPMLEVRRGSGVVLPVRRVEMPADAPAHVRAETVDLEDGFPPALYERMQTQRAALLEAVQRAVVRHLERCAQFERHAFPCRERLTGDYYLGPGESYELAADGRPGVVVKARCLGWSDPWNPADRGQSVDYLGIDVYVEFDAATETFSGEPFSLQAL